MFILLEGVVLHFIAIM